MLIAKPSADMDILRHLSVQDFLGLGLQQIAYIRPVQMNGVAAYGIHAADGTPLAFHADEDVARAITMQNDMEVMTLH